MKKSPTAPGNNKAAPLRALVFDDDGQVRSFVTSILENRGYEVRGFSDPGTCPLVQEPDCPCPFGLSCCDLIISDLNMPTMSGLELIEHQKNHGCKVQNLALMSGAWTAELRQRAEELGCQVFDKPFPISEMIEWLERCENHIQPGRQLLNLSEESPLLKSVETR